MKTQKAGHVKSLSDQVELMVWQQRLNKKIAWQKQAK